MHTSLFSIPQRRPGREREFGKLSEAWRGVKLGELDAIPGSEPRFAAASPQFGTPSTAPRRSPTTRSQSPRSSQTKRARLAQSSVRAAWVRCGAPEVYRGLVAGSPLVSRGSGELPAILRQASGRAGRSGLRRRRHPATAWGACPGPGVHRTGCRCQAVVERRHMMRACGADGLRGFNTSGGGGRLPVSRLRVTS